MDDDRAEDQEELLAECLPMRLYIGRCPVWCEEFRSKNQVRYFLPKIQITNIPVPVCWASLLTQRPPVHSHDPTLALYREL